MLVLYSLIVDFKRRNKLYSVKLIEVDFKKTLEFRLHMVYLLTFYKVILQLVKH